jgi:hypothetical protein
MTNNIFFAKHAPMNELITEIQDDIKREKWLALWQRFGRTIIASAVAVVVGVAANQAWQAYRQQKSEEYTTKILEAVRKPDAKVFEKVARETKGVHSGMAHLIQAQLLMADGKRSEAKKILRKLANDKSNAMPNELARALLVDAKLDTNSKSAFHATALERSGWAAIEAGEFGAAKKAFDVLLQMETAPESMKERAKSALAFISAQPASASSTTSDALEKKE